MMRTWLALAVVALTGCDLYFSGGDDVIADDVCEEYPPPETPPAQQVFDPSTGTCTTVNGWEGCNSCGCQGGGTYINMAPCVSGCTGLSQDACTATPGCYGIYDIPKEGDPSLIYAGCQQTVQGPLQGMCQGLDPYTCSLYDNCAIEYQTNYDAGQSFAACIDEPASTKYCVDDQACGDGAHCDTSSCYSDPSCMNGGICTDVCYGVCVSDYPSCAAVDCGPGYHCEDNCYPGEDPTGPVMDTCQAACVPDQNSCANVDCQPGYTCVDSCYSDQGDVLWCGPQCVPSNVDPGSCTGQVACDALPPACPTGTTAGRANGCWTGYCIPNADCGTNDPGQCYGDPACAQPSPQCPQGTTPGIANGCYTGYCIPNSQCEAAPCESLTTESSCTSRFDCSPVYNGTGCTCDANGCTCQTLTFARCEEGWML